MQSSSYSLFHSRSVLSLDFFSTSWHCVIVHFFPQSSLPTSLSSLSSPIGISMRVASYHAFSRGIVCFSFLLIFPPFPSFPKNTLTVFALYISFLSCFLLPLGLFSFFFFAFFFPRHLCTMMHLLSFPPVFFFLFWISRALNFLFVTLGFFENTSPLISPSFSLESIAILQSSALSRTSPSASRVAWTNSDCLFFWLVLSKINFFPFLCLVPSFLVFLLPCRRFSLLAFWVRLL